MRWSRPIGMGAAYCLLVFDRKGHALYGRRAGGCASASVDPHSAGTADRSKCHLSISLRSFIFERQLHVLNEFENFIQLAINVGQREIAPQTGFGLRISGSGQ